jgi:hypothetical protein
MFGLFKKKQVVQQPAPVVFQPNEMLKEAVGRHNARPGEEYIVHSLYRSLSQGFLMVAVDHPLPVNSSGVLEQETTIKTLTSTAPTGGLALLVFTDQNEAFKRIAGRTGIGVIAQTSLDVLQMSISGNCEGVIINPAVPRAYVPRSAVQEIMRGKYA